MNFNKITLLKLKIKVCYSCYKVTNTLTFNSIKSFTANIQLIVGTRYITNYKANKNTICVI